jgi:hypothetical protein
MVAMIATLKTGDAIPSATSLDHVNLDHVIFRTAVRAGRANAAKPCPFTTERDRSQGRSVESCGRTTSYIIPEFHTCVIIAPDI